MINNSCIHDISDECAYRCYKHGYRFNCANCPDYLHNVTWGKLMMQKMAETKKKSFKWEAYCSHYDNCIECPHLEKCKEVFKCKNIV